MSAALDRLLRHPDLWRPGALPRASGRAVPTGHAALDARLPGGGWPLGALTELLAEREGVGELRLLMPALARLSGRGDWILWAGPPRVPYAPALASHGVALERLLWVRASCAAQILWAAEQALRSGICAAVLLWASRLEPRALRRLQLAAESSEAWAVLFRRQCAPDAASPAALRLRLATSERGLAVTVLKCRGKAGGEVEIDLGDR